MGAIVSRGVRGHASREIFKTCVSEIARNAELNQSIVVNWDMLS